MSDVLLVTCADWPDGEPGGRLLVEEIAARGRSARWVVWDDATVDWAAARLVAVRSTWDYESRREEFLSWARSVPAPLLLNGAEVFAWNTDKAYLVALAEEVPVVPTVLVDEPAGLDAAVTGFGRAVVKPRVGAGGRGVRVLPPRPGDPAEDVVPAGPWVVQPLLESVRTEGEASVFVLGGTAVSQVRKLPSGGEIRVHEEYGGRADAVPLAGEAAGLAERTVRAAERRLAATLSYARADLMRLDDGTLVVGELEATEPGLYLDVLPGNAAAFARLLQPGVG